MMWSRLWSRWCFRLWSGWWSRWSRWYLDDDLDDLSDDLSDLCRGVKQSHGLHTSRTCLHVTNNVNTNIAPGKTQNGCYWPLFHPYNGWLRSLPRQSLFCPVFFGQKVLPTYRRSREMKTFLDMPEAVVGDQDEFLMARLCFPRDGLSWNGGE